MKKDGRVALYHEMRKRDSFEDVAKALFEMVGHAIKTSPTGKRVLFLDIEGHRNKAGGFDKDAFELMQDYLLGMLLPYLSEIRTPLYHIKNKSSQRNDLPEKLIIQSSQLG